MKLFEKIMYPILLLFVFASIILAKTNLNYFESVLTSEDGFFQWMTFYTLLFASLMAFYRAKILMPFRGQIFSTCLILFCILFLFFALDEVSWLQNVFNFKSPRFFLDHNEKLQTNFHNLVIYGHHINNLVFTFFIKIVATIYFLVLPFFYRKILKLKTFLNQFAIPVPRYTHTLAYFLLGCLVSLIDSSSNVVIFEFGFYWIFTLMMYHPLNDEVFSRVSLVR